MVNGSCHICHYSCGFVYGWYHNITKHKFYEVLNLFVVFKIQHIQIKAACQNNMLSHSVTLCIKTLKVVFTNFYISNRGSVDCIKNYLFTLFIKNLFGKRFHCLRINTQILYPFEEVTCVQMYLSLHPCDSSLSDATHYNQVVGLKNHSLVFCHLLMFLRSILC